MVTVEVINKNDIVNSRCKKCGGSIVKDQDGKQICISCGRGSEDNVGPGEIPSRPANPTGAHQYYLQHKDAIVTDYKTKGLQFTASKWNIYESQLYKLITAWNIKQKSKSIVTKPGPPCKPIPPPSKFSLEKLFTAFTRIQSHLAAGSAKYLAENLRAAQQCLS